jgi:hypothetical protein
MLRLAVVSVKQNLYINRLTGHTSL